MVCLPVRFGFSSICYTLPLPNVRLSVKEFSRATRTQRVFESPRSTRKLAIDCLCVVGAVLESTGTVPGSGTGMI
jgi:hypothetical protein